MSLDDNHSLVQKYRDFSPESARIAQRAQRVFPGGDTRASAHYLPYPLVVTQAQGTVLTDVDGNRLLDFMNNFTSLIHGHAFGDVVTAVQKQIAQGSAYAAPNEDQIALGELIQARIPSIERLRFTSSGTEATQMAIRCARAATGRQKIMKMEGGYHGSYELAEVSLVAHPKKRGPLEAPNSVPVDASFPQSVLGDTVVCPYNQPDLARALIDAHAGEIAAVIVEPVLGSMGMVPASSEFLKTLRDATAKHGIVLIFDEVITFRLSPAGAQLLRGVEPDLTCLGKIIGGGLPIGAVGGKESLMSLFSPLQSQPIMHASTFSGNALSMAAGLAAMNSFGPQDIDRINGLGAKLREGFSQAFAQANIKAQALGEGSLVNLLFTDEKVIDARQSMAAMYASRHIAPLLHLSMLRHGVMSASRLMFCINTAMDQSDIDLAVTAMHESLAELRPFVETAQPDLLN